MQISVSGLIPAILVGYLLTVLIEAPVLLLGLSPRHSMKQRLLAGFLLTACSYPFIALVFPIWFHPQTLPYFLVAESFAPISECLLFWWLFCRAMPVDARAQARDWLVIILANLLSFALGELLKELNLLHFRM